MILINNIPVAGDETGLTNEALANAKFSGESSLDKSCQSWFEHIFNSSQAPLAPCCTAALDMVIRMPDTLLVDKVIMPSYSFVSTANTVVPRGASVKFMGGHPETLPLHHSVAERDVSYVTESMLRFFA